MLTILIDSYSYARVGLMTKFSDVVLEGLDLGETYNLRASKNIPYVITSMCDNPTDVIVEIVTEGQVLQQEYEHLSDHSWIKIIPERFRLTPGESRSCEVIITIPLEEKYKGRHFQATIWAHTSPPREEGITGGVFAAGVRSRFRFSIGPGPESLAKEKKRKAMLTLDFDVSPENLYISGVDPGKLYDSKKMKQKSIVITNRADDPVNIKLTVEAIPERMGVSAGYEKAQDVSWVILKPSIIKLKGMRVKPSKICINIPDKEEYYNKKYVFLVKAEVVNADVPIEIGSKLYITTSSIEEKLRKK